MRLFIGSVLALALGVMGCSETSCPNCGGEGGSGGDGGPVSDCSAVEQEVECLFDGGVGVCVGDVCYATDCSVLEDGTSCASYSIGVGVCETFADGSECVAGVFDCAGIPDETRCAKEIGGYLGLCFDEMCYVDGDYCPRAEPGDLCWFDPTGWGNITPGRCALVEGDTGCNDVCEVLGEGAECLQFFGGSAGVCDELGQCVVE
jgi:hypothetical protein